MLSPSGLSRSSVPDTSFLAPSPEAFHGGPQVVPAKPQVKRETAIDILYENERGGFLCGRPLFSSAALGSLDPPAWSEFDDQMGSQVRSY